MMSRNVIHVIRHNADFKICGLNFLGCPGMFFLSNSLFLLNRLNYESYQKHNSKAFLLSLVCVISQTFPLSACFVGV